MNERAEKILNGEKEDCTIVMAAPDTSCSKAQLDCLYSELLELLSEIQQAKEYAAYGNRKVPLINVLKNGVGGRDVLEVLEV